MKEKKTKKNKNTSTPVDKEISGPIYEGILDATKSGVGYVICEDLERDIFIAQDMMTSALDGDLVQVQLVKAYNPDKKPRGRIIKILERKNTKVIGTISKTHYGFSLIPNDPKNAIIFDVLGETTDLETLIGKVVLAKICDELKKGKYHCVEIEKVFGNLEDTDTDYEMIFEKYGLSDQFSQSISQELEQIPIQIPPSEIANRKDLRDTYTLTIDPYDAKDFDDALSFKALPNERYEIGIHIADVSHYVKPGTALDLEAQQRATSVYLVNKVVPMLPELLSNTVCSLRPNEDSLVFSAIFEIDKQANIHKTWFGKSIIHSHRRFTYEQAQDIIEGQQDKDQHIVLTLNEIAVALRTQRAKTGSIFFDKKEPKFILDEHGEPTEVMFKTAKDSNHLIEEFMLLANKSVAAFLQKKYPKKPVIYRVHDKPDAEKILELQEIVKKFGYQLDLSSDNTLRHSINEVIEQVKGKPEQNMIDLLAIRSMSKACYATNNIGHYGLAFKDYTHFTSPIRRYADVIVHRLLDSYLSEAPIGNQEEYDEICHHIFKKELDAISAERESIKYMQVKYLSKHLDELFEGSISGVAHHGLFVELKDNGCEGLVSRTSLASDTFYYDNDKQALVGQDTNQEYLLGQAVMVKIEKTDLQKKYIDFLLLEQGT